MVSKNHSEKRLDIALALGSAAFAALALRLGWDESQGTAAVWIIAFAIAACLALALSRVRPLVSVLTVLAAHIVVVWVNGNDLALAPAAAIALFALSRSEARRSTLLVAVCIAVSSAFVVALAGDDWFLTEFLGEAAQMLLAVAVGDGVRSRERRLEERIETETAARVQAERLRIARDLHDVVAHGLSVIAVQSGVAAHLLDRNPEQARDALVAINAAGRSSLEELRSMVGVLRSDDGAELRPVPTAAGDFGALEQQAVLAGLQLRRTGVGEFPAWVSDSCVIAVHRIVQEALTNVSCHAGGVGVELHLEHAATEVAVCVQNEPGRQPVPERPSEAGGSGIEGMAERAQSLGGSVVAEPLADGGFRVTAVVPYQRVSK